MKLALHLLVILVAFLLLLIGILGLVLPIISGILLIILALMILLGKDKVSRFLLKILPKPLKKYFSKDGKRLR